MDASHDHHPDVVCPRCGTHYPADVAEVMFARHRRALGIHRARHSVCIPCEQTRRDDKKRARRWLTKARDTLKNHAKNYDLSPEAFGARYGWDVERIAHDLEHAYANTCCYCWNPYAEMGHGLADVTLDIEDPDDPPYYANTTPCCITCNRAKARLTKDQWARRLQGWRLWRQARDRTDKPTQLALAWQTR